MQIYQRLPKKCKEYLVIALLGVLETKFHSLYCFFQNVVKCNFSSIPAGISCTGRSQRDIALGKEILLLAKRYCSWLRDIALGKEIWLLAKRYCSWTRDLALDSQREDMGQSTIFKENIINLTYCTIISMSFPKNVSK